MDAMKLDGYQSLIGTAQADLKSTLSQRDVVDKKLVEAATAVKRITQTVQAATRQCEKAISQVQQLESKESSLMNIS